MRAGDLRVEARQLVEIARALSYGARFIILDEPTAQLDGDEIKRLFRRMRELQAQGVTFLFISHHLQEVYEICQAVTVLRDARHIISAPVADLPKDRLIEAMTGEQVHFGFADAAGRTIPADAPIALDVDDLSRRGFRGRQLHRAPRRGARHLRRHEQRPRRRGRGDRRAWPLTGRHDPRSTTRRCRRATFPRPSRSASAACRRAGTSRAWSCRSRSPTTPP